MRVFFGYLFVALLFVSCRSNKPSQEKVVTSEMSEIVGEVGDQKITQQDLLNIIEEAQSMYPRVYSTHPQKLEFLTQLMNLHLLYEEALKENLQNDFAFKTKLAEVYINRLAREARSKVSEREIQNYFDTHKNAISQISARHILIKVKRSASKEERAAAKQKISEIRDIAIKEPARFAELAEKNSQDSSASGGGDLGYFSRPMMVKPFSDAAFSLQKIGDISPIVETEFGFHIIQLNGDRRDIKFYKDALRDKIVREAQATKLQEKIESLKKSKKFKIYEASLTKLSPLPKEVLTPPGELIPEDGVVEPKK